MKIVLLHASLQIVPHCFCTSHSRRTVQLYRFYFYRSFLKWELCILLINGLGYFHCPTQASCWYCEAMACIRSGCKTGLSAVTCLSWSSVINTIPVAIRHFEHTVTALLINNRLDISTAPWSLLEETVIPRSLLLFTVTHLTELCTEIVATPNPSSRKSCWWFGQLCVACRTRSRRRSLYSTCFPFMITNQSKLSLFHSGNVALLPRSLNKSSWT